MYKESFMASLLDRIYDNYRLYLIKEQAEEMHKLIQGRSFDESEKIDFCKKHGLTMQDLQDLLQDDLDSFIDRHCGKKDFPWIAARLSNFLKADALLDEYRDRGWTIFVKVFHKANDDRVIRVVTRDPSNKLIEELTQDFYSTVHAENWIAWKLQTEHPLTTTISKDLRANYPVSDIKSFDASNYNNALELSQHYMDEIADLYCNIRIRQKEQGFVYTTSISKDENSASFFYNHKNDIPKYTKDFSSHYNAIVWLALSIERDFPIKRTIAEKLDKEFPIWNPDELPSYTLDAIIRSTEHPTQIFKPTKTYLKKYIHDVLAFNPE